MLLPPPDGPSGILAFTHALVTQTISLVISLQKETGGYVHASQIQRLAHCCGVDSPLSASLLEAQNHFSCAKQEYPHLKPQATELQEDYL